MKLMQGANNSEENVKQHHPDQVEAVYGCLKCVEVAT